MRTAAALVAVFVSVLPAVSDAAEKQGVRVVRDVPYLSGVSYAGNKDKLDLYLPEGRTGKLIARPVLRDHELAYLGRSGAPAEAVLDPSDLMVSVRGERIVLRSRRLGREVIPRLTSAHNFALRSVGVFGAQLGSGPLLLPVVVRRDEENFLFHLDRLVAPLGDPGDEQHHGGGLVPARQVVEIFVLVEGRNAGRYVLVVVAEQHDHPVARLAHDSRPPFVINRERLALPCRGELCCGECHRD